QDAVAVVRRGAEMSFAQPLGICRIVGYVAAKIRLLAEKPRERHEPFARLGLSPGETAEVIGATDHAFEPADLSVLATADVAEGAAIGTDLMDIDRAFEHAVRGVNVQIAAPGVGQFGVREHALPKRIIVVVDLRVDVLHANG